MRIFRWITRIGPGFVIAAVVLGPGSLTAATRLGASYGYSLLWLPLLAGLFMAGFVALFMRFGLTARHSVLGHVAALTGRPFAALCGLAMFYVASAFQFGNNIGVATGMQSLLWPEGQAPLPPWSWVVIFNAAALLFLFTFKRIYATIEKTMTVLVAVMVVVFFANLYFARPSLEGIAAGFRPALPAELDRVAVGGMIATTFSIVGALFQVYLVRARGWTADAYRRGLVDSLAGMAILTAVSLVVMITSAATLHPLGLQVRSAADMAGQLQQMFGSLSRVIFCIGYVSAAFSSFLVNAMIGGTLLADGLGLGDDVNRWPARLGSGLSLLFGMGIALLILLGQRLTFADALLLGEAGTLLGVPLAIVAAMLVLLAPRRSQGRPLGLAGVLFVLAGVALLAVSSALVFGPILKKVVHALGR